MAAARGFFDQYSVFCVFGSVVGCVVVPLITQSFESLIFSAIVITLTANRLSKRVLANEQRSAGHSPTAGAERRRATAIGTSSGSLASGKKRKKSGWPTSQQQGSLNFDYEDLRRRREEEEEVKRREMEQREEDRREKKARKKMERRERKEQERIIREKEEEEKQKRLEARLNHHQKRLKGSGTAPPSLLEMDFPHHQIETISSWRDQPVVQRASSTSSIASSSSNCSNPSPRNLRPQSPPTRKPYRPLTSSASSTSSSRPWYLPTKQVLKPCSISYDASGPSLTAPPPPPPPVDEAGSSTWVSGSSKPKETESTSTVSALRIEDVEPGRFVTEDLLKLSVYDSPFTEPLPVFNSYNPFGANDDVVGVDSKESTTSDPGPRLYSLFGQEAKSGMFGQLVGNESV